MIKKLAGTLLPQALLAFGAPAAQAAPPEPFNTGARTSTSIPAKSGYCHRRSVSVGQDQNTRETFVDPEGAYGFNVLIVPPTSATTATPSSPRSTCTL